MGFDDGMTGIHEFNSYFMKKISHKNLSKVFNRIKRIKDMLTEQNSSNQLASREKMAEHELRAKRIFLEFSGILWNFSGSDRAGLRRVPRRSPTSYAQFSRAS